MSLKSVRNFYYGFTTNSYSTVVSRLSENCDVSTNISLENQYERLVQSVTPLASLEYPKQLTYKNKFAENIIKTIYRNKNVSKFRTKVSKIIASPVTEGYRNKDEFSVNKGIDGDPKTVGFYVGSFSKGDIVCVPPLKLINLKKKHVQIAQLYQEFIRVSPLRACLNFNDGGFWRNLVVKSNRKNETMVNVIVHPNGSSYETLKDTMIHLSEYFSGRDIDSLHYQVCPHTRCSNNEAPYQLLFGKKYLIEELGPYKFQISPDSFFQVNTLAAEILYEKIIELTEVSKRSTLLDLCSGTGAVSFFASSKVRGCVGIEMMEEAVNDAVANANLNSVTNCNFIAAAVEKVLPKVLRELDCCDVIAVLNPGRSGVLKNVIKVLRNCRSIRNLIYIACKADNHNTMDNFINLLDPKFNNSEAFVLSKVQPVDMFPHTKHCEMIMVFQR